MARESLSRPARTTAGAVVSTYAVTADGIAFPFSSTTVLLVRNGSSSSVDVTFKRPGTVDGTTLSDKVVTVAADTYEVFYGWLPELYAQSDGMLYVDFSSTTNVWVMVL